MKEKQDRNAKRNRGYITLLVMSMVFISSMVKGFAADVAYISFQEKDHNLLVDVNYNLNDLEVISAGLLTSVGTGDLTMDTSGRIRIAFTQLDENASCQFEVPDNEENQNKQFRAYLIAKRQDGSVKTYYSKQYTPVNFNESNWEIIDGNVIYRHIQSGMEVVGVINKVQSLAIPAQLKGETIIKIADNAFENDNILEEIDLPDTVQVIGTRAFAGCTSLISMY